MAIRTDSRGTWYEMEVSCNSKVEWRPVGHMVRDQYICGDGRIGFLLSYEPKLADNETIEWEQYNPIPRIVARVDNLPLNGG